MKSLKKITHLSMKLLFATLVTTAFATTPIIKAEMSEEQVMPKPASEQKYAFPEYTLKGKKPDRVYYIAETPVGDKLINNALEAHGWPYFLSKEYDIDLNNDGQIDLVHHEFHLSEKIYFKKGCIKFIMPLGAEAPEGYELVIEEPYKALNLYIDDTGDGKSDRILTDEINEKGKLGADGIFEVERKLN